MTRNLTAQSLTYATGRTMEVGDRAEIERIVAKPEKGEGGFLAQVRRDFGRS